MFLPRFLIAGDLRKAKGPCKRSDYEEVATLLRISYCPVFVLPGDNDWIDCDPNIDEGLELFTETFAGFEGKHWDHNFDIQRQEEYPTNFAFIHKGTLFVGLNIIGGDIHSEEEWETRLTAEVE